MTACLDALEGYGFDKKFEAWILNGPMPLNVDSVHMVSIDAQISDYSMNLII